MILEEEDKELQRQSLLLESLVHNEAFILWRKEIVLPVIELIEMKITQQEALSEAVLRGNVIAKHLITDAFYKVFDQIKATNDQDRELNKSE